MTFATMFRELAALGYPEPMYAAAACDCAACRDIAADLLADACPFGSPVEGGPLALPLDDLDDIPF